VEAGMSVGNELIVVFGGSSGIGEAVARRLLAEGNHVVIVGRHPDRLAKASDRLGAGIQTAPVDAADRDAVDTVFTGLNRSVCQQVNRSKATASKEWRRQTLGRSAPGR
jgi:NADP-dependent 3-hydroxy acid dehydrogenase YdfG